MLREQINDALKAALKNQDRRRICTLRLINAAIKDRDIAARGEGREMVGDDAIREILTKMVRQRQESVRIYEEAGRMELAEQEGEEMEIISGFLPRQMSEDEVRKACESVVTDIGASGLRDMGRTMTTLKQRYPGRMDFGRASCVVKEMLN